MKVQCKECSIQRNYPKDYCEKLMVNGVVEYTCKKCTAKINRKKGIKDKDEKKKFEDPLKKYWEKEKQYEKDLKKYAKSSSKLRTFEEQLKADEKGLKDMVKNNVPQTIIERRKRIIDYKRRFAF